MSEVSENATKKLVLPLFQKHGSNLLWRLQQYRADAEQFIEAILHERDALQSRLDAILSHNPNAEPRIREWTEADERAAYPERFGLPHHGSKGAK